MTTGGALPAGASLVGLISDTHGLLRPTVVAALRGVELIVHAGDVGSVEVLDGLRALAPVVAVRGNTDGGALGRALPPTAVVALAGGLALYVLHDLGRLDLDPRAAGFAAVIFGHSHRPRREERDGVLYVNPGSAGPRRFDCPIACARLRVAGPQLEAELLALAG